MPFDSLLQRKIMGRFATGVTVVTTVHDGELRGMTANAVASLSLDPPLILVAVARQAQMHAHLTASRFFAVNILDESQQELSQRFAKPGPKEFADLAWRAGETGAPLFEQGLGWLDCELHSILPGGDHDIFVGQIVAGDHRDGAPLLYFSGKYQKLAE
ncbi:MAG: flavin reductase family protein [Pirellulales bacterium]